MGAAWTPCLLRPRPRLLLLLALAATAILGATTPAYAAIEPPPPNAGFDYQIGGDYPLPKGVSVVSRDWFSGEAAGGGAYSICYVNAFQTQDNERGTDRPDERSNWPRRLVLRKLGDDPSWGGEYLIDLSTKAKRRAAANWVRQMVDGCASKGFDGVEFDNLDSWTRFDGTPLARRVPFGKGQALDYARRLARMVHSRGLAAGQKNAPQLTRAQVTRADFDFAIVEECGRYRECGRYTRLHGNRVIAIEYRRRDFERACRTVGDELSVVLRDRQVRTPTSRRYLYNAC